jgi:hypothetical protein
MIGRTIAPPINHSPDIMKGSATAAEGPLPIGAASRISNFFAREFRFMEVDSDLPTTRELGFGSDFGVIEAHAGRFRQ